MSSLIPRASPQLSVLSDNSYVHRSIHHANPANSLYGLKTESANAVPPFNLSPQPAVPCSSEINNTSNCDAQQSFRNVYGGTSVNHVERNHAMSDENGLPSTATPKITYSANQVQNRPMFLNKDFVSSPFAAGSLGQQSSSTVLSQQWSSPIRVASPVGPTYTKQMEVSGPIGQQAECTPLRPFSHVNCDTSTSVPSASPLLYGHQNVPSPNLLTTPVMSQPLSTGISPNPTPISAQRYNLVEGQFLNRPSLSSSSDISNLGCTTNNSATQYMFDGTNKLFPPPSGSNYAASVSPFVSPVVAQPMHMTPVSRVSAISKYPSQFGYNLNQYSSEVMTSQPTSIQSISPLTQPYPPYGGVLDGPVGGVSGYDPSLHARMAGMSVSTSMSKLWGSETINLLQDQNILPVTPLEAPIPVLPVEKPNCSPKVFRCTLTKVPDTNSLLQKSRLPFGILIHPFRDMSLPVIQCNTIVRCRSCRTYINPFVTFLDNRKWQCNLCFRPNDLPEEFLYGHSMRSYGDHSSRPEVRNASVEYIAPSDYMFRPPQPAAYLFLLDVSHGACDTGYLEIFCNRLLEHLDDIPGDSRTRIGFITFDRSIHFYNLAEGLSQPHMLIVSDFDDVFLPSPDDLLVNLYESKELVRYLLEDLPKRFENNGETRSCLGAALQVAYKLLAPVGGRITVIQTRIPDCGPGMLKNKEDPNQRATKDVSHIRPADDFYKKLALECSNQQIAVDLFLLCSQYIDIATMSCISKFSSGCVQYYPGYHKACKSQIFRLDSDLRRYFTRRIGFEAVMRIRCTRGLSIHTFHGNFFVRSTDLLSLPNVNPDVGFGMQISIEESFKECNSVCFQAAILYTSPKGERRIRVHTLCLPLVSMLNDVWCGVDQEAVIALVCKMAVDRSVASSLSDARDALINVAVDLLGAFKLTLQSSQCVGALMIPYSARLIPLFVLGLLKHIAFRTGISTKLDERIYAMERMKTLPMSYLIKYIYPTLYPVHALDDNNAIPRDKAVIPQPVILQLSSGKIDRYGAYILDTVDVIYLYVGKAVNNLFCQNVLGVLNFSAIPEDMTSLPELDTTESRRMRNFISWLQEERPCESPFRVIREDSSSRSSFLQYMLDDRTESLFSYHEFLQHLRQQVSN